MHYLDNAATTQVAPAVIETITRTLRENFANSSALYSPALASEHILEDSRRTLAAALGCTPAEVIFTASGSEGNNIALWGAAFARKNWADEIVVSGYEHASLYHPCEQLAALGYAVRFVAPTKEGIITPQMLADVVGPKTALVAAMQVNNETGALLDVAETVRLVKQKNPRTAVHADCVQAFMKFPLSVSKAGLDSCTVVGHKLHAPKGIGALYLRRGYRVLPPYLGGKQENGLRPGTENVPYIAGFAKAVELLSPSLESRFTHVSALNRRLRETVLGWEDAIINSPENASPYIFNFSLPGLRSETVLHFLEQYEVYISSASACGKGAASHTLGAMQLPAERIDSSLRISLCGDTTNEDLDALFRGLTDARAMLVRTGKFQKK